jgi:hypothetical protein
MSKKSVGNRENKTPDFPGELEKSFKAVVNAYGEINQELERMKKVKNQYEKAIEAYLTEIEKNPSKYKRRVVKGKETVEEVLTKKDILSLKKSLRKRMVGTSAVQFFVDWDDCECREREFCVRLNCDPIWFLGCCYLCLSPAVIQCS